MTEAARSPEPVSPPSARRGGLASAAGRGINPGLFLVVVVCFFLPFFTVQCSAAIPEALEGLAEGIGEGNQLDFAQGDLSESVTGWQLVIGDTGEAAPAPGDQAVEDPGPDFVAVAAFLVAALGLAFSWLRRPIGPILAIVLGVAGTGLLIWLWQRIAGRIPQEAQAFVSLNPQPAFWVAVVASALAAVWGVLRLAFEREPPRPAAERPPPARDTSRPAEPTPP